MEKTMKQKKDFIPPMDDDVAKNLFGDRKNMRFTTGFLTPMLGLPEDEYRKLAIANPALLRRWKTDKLCILDVLVETNSGIVVHVEFQVEGQTDFIKRITYYLAKLIADQMGSGFKYDQVHPTISVVITSHPVKPGEPGYLNSYGMCNLKTGGLFTDLQKLIIVDLSKVPETDDGTALWPWLKFLKCKSLKEIEMLVVAHPEIGPMVVEYKKMTLGQRWRAIREEKEKIWRDKMAREDFVREEGKQEATLTLARKLKAQGVSVEQIAGASGLSPEEVARL
jgi:predicted transposase/invertase (TIGR01784 family)